MTALLELSCRALLFDLDGVLVDSTASVGRVWRVWAEQRGLDAEAVIRTAHGRRSIETIRVWAPGIDAEAENRIVEQMEIDDTLDLKVIAGARELLASVRNVPWAVVTSGTRALAESRLRAAGLQVPAVMISADDVTHGKPHPEPWLKGAAALGVAPADCLVFEDTPPGIDSAHAAGIRVVALTTTYPTAALHSAEGVVASLADITLRPDPGSSFSVLARCRQLPEIGASR